MIEVEGINITITGDVAKLEEAARRATSTINSMSHNVNNNAKNIRDAFDRIGNSAARFRDMLEMKGIEATPANIRIIKQAYKELEDEAKAAAAAVKKLADEQKQVQTNANKATLRDAKAEHRRDMQRQAKYEREYAERKRQQAQTAKKNYEERFRKAKAEANRARTTQQRGEQAASNAEMKRRRKKAAKDAADQKTMEDNARKYVKRDQMAEARDKRRRMRALEVDLARRMRATEKARKERERNEEKARKEVIAKHRAMANQRATIANKAALYSGLASGTVIGGRIGFASGFFGGRVGSNIGGMLGGTPGAIIGGIGGGLGGMALAAGAKMMQMYLEASVALMTKINSLAMEFLGSSLKLGIEYEKQLTSFRVLTGSKEKGNKLYEDIEKIAINSPYKTSQLTKQAEILLGSGIKAEHVPAFIGRIGDMAGGNMERFHYIAKAFSDVNAAGRLRGQELNQFSNQGIGREDFALALGMDKYQFERKMAKGEITRDLVFEAGNKLTDPGGRFHGYGKEIATTTVGGALESLEETFESVQKKLGDMLLKKFNVAEILNKLINGMGDFDMSKIEAWVERGKKAFTPLGAVVIRFADYIVTSTVRLAQSLPSWEEFASVVSDSVDRYLPPLIELFKTMGVVTLALGRVMLAFTGFVIKTINTISQSSIVKKTIGDLPEIPNIARQGTLDKWMENMQKGFKSMGDPTNMITNPGKSIFPETMKHGTALLGPFGKIFFEDKIPAIREGITDFAKMFAPPPAFSKEVMDLVEKIDKQIKEGTHPHEKFQKGINKLNQARFPSDPNVSALIGDKEYNVGVMDFVKTLQHDMKDFMDHMPHTGYAGTSDAQSIINANITMQTNDIQGRILMAIEASKIVQEQQLEQEKLIVEAVKKGLGINENGF